MALLSDIAKSRDSWGNRMQPNTLAYVSVWYCSLGNICTTTYCQVIHWSDVGMVMYKDYVKPQFYIAL